ncbi:M20 family metallopeptidase [Pseudomonas sp. 5P_5.1_Bac1]|uniref:M20 metallopeptidase family protein n=1 Tax=Pseudomonas sp. 5P_5.1_Bac1 TaxID=2971616 RepID=UPI0021C6BB2B|nr:amidohydrolase [Pseudomonas sp. 5P_5.1_Bac1]MCU1725257.1 amidohydrolase [Pseudomonas sp. 5P_5.1_Bac1]
MPPYRKTLVALFLGLLAGPISAAPTADWGDLDARIAKALPGVIALRHEIHQHPELGNREVETAKRIAKRLRELGLEVQTGVAHTGVVGILRGGKPGPVVAIRAELDALPLTEQTGLPFASTVRVPDPSGDLRTRGKEVGVMHACGHDAHMAMALGVAEVLAARRDELPGTLKLIFQPAEEGPPLGEAGGAKLMIEQGVLQNPAPAVIFGIHVTAGTAGTFTLSRTRTTAAADTFVARIKGRQTHAAFPWTGIDPVPVAAQTILAWQTIPSRQSNLSVLPAPVISVGRIEAGDRHNIIPAEVRLEGSIRTVSDEQREDVLQRMRRTAEKIAEASGASAEIDYLPGNYRAGHNDTALVDSLLPVLEQVSTTPVKIDNGTYGADDFAEYAREIPGIFMRMGVTPPALADKPVWPTHSPGFQVDDPSLAVGIRALSRMTLSYMQRQ